MLVVRSYCDESNLWWSVMNSVSDGLGMLGFRLIHLDKVELSSILKPIIIHIIHDVKWKGSKVNMNMLETHVSNIVRQLYIEL